MKNQTIQALVTKLLEDPLGHKWTVQGFGMFRLYLPEADARLHIWDSKFRVDDVSDIHTHPWDFTSTVILGEIRNLRLVETAEAPDLMPYAKQAIRCGEGGGVVGDPEIVYLIPKDDEEVYRPGQVYVQKADEIHFSAPRDGTVTIVERTFKADTEHAYVYHPADAPWVSAEPRPATNPEIAEACLRALGKIE